MLLLVSVGVASAAEAEHLRNAVSSRFEAVASVMADGHPGEMRKSEVSEREERQADEAQANEWTDTADDVEEDEEQRTAETEQGQSAGDAAGMMGPATLNPNHRRQLHRQHRFRRYIGFSATDIRTQLMALLDVPDKHKVPYWLDFGTLLGVVREGDVIKGDHDADISITTLDGERMFNKQGLREDLQAKGYNLVKSRNNAFKTYPNSCSCARGKEQAYCGSRCQNVDLFQFRLDKSKKCMMRKCFYRDWETPCSSGVKGSSFPTQLLWGPDGKNLGQLKVGKWNNRAVPVPYYFDGFLKFRYGDWKTPHADYTGPDRGCSPDSADEWTKDLKPPAPPVAKSTVCDYCK